MESQSPENDAEDRKDGRFDPWSALEDACLRAFSAYANPSAPGLVATLRRAVRYAKIDSARREIVVDRRAFIFGLMSTGLQDQPSRDFGNAATWAANWIAARAGPPLPGVVQSAVTGTDILLRSFNEGLKVVASGSMRAAGERAVYFAQTTVHRSRADLRHMLAALLEDDVATAKDFSALGWTPALGDYQSIRRELFDRIAATPEPIEANRLDVWRDILEIGEAEATPRQTTIDGGSYASGTGADAVDGGSYEDSTPDRNPANPSTESRSTGAAPPPFVPQVAPFASDHAEPSEQDSDPLQVRADIEAFARLICLKDVQLPLSIGLFGGWGSGKSTFMLKLEAAIDALTEKARKRPEPTTIAPAGTPSFVRNVVQIRFNAWHFADANLWASLTAEFFDQLRAGGYARSGKVIHTRLVERVNAHVHALSSDVASAREALASSEAALRAAQKVRNDAVAQVEAAPNRALRQTMVDQVTKAFEAHRGDLQEMGRRTYHDDPGRDIGDFMELAKSVQKSGGQIKALATFVFARGWRATLAICGVLLTAAGIALIAFADLTEWSFRLNALKVFTMLAGVGAFARAVLPGMRLIAGLIDSTAGFAAGLDKTIEADIKAVAQADEAVRRATAEADARRQAADRAAKALARYVDPQSSVGNPPRLLRFLLEDDPDTRTLEKEIGLISRVRRLFQSVDEIVREERDKMSDKRDADVPDRIVIYIDDLDRCTPAQVYAVLQAIHLLLAFRLFVVVVGVDVAWVTEVLARELRPGVKNGQPAAQTDIDERKLATRYMEKIFQLPFWLRSLSPTGGDGGSYGRFVRDLLKSDTMARREAQPKQTPAATTGSPGDPSGPAASAAGATPEPPAAAAPSQSPPSSEESAPHAGQAASATYEEALSTVRLTQEEVDFLSWETIGHLAGREPRTVKRFVNIYRILRARLDAADRARLLGEDGDPPDFPTVAILIAIETGQPVDVVERFHERLSAWGRETFLADVDPWRGPSASMERPVVDPLLHLAFAQAAELSGHSASAADCLRWSPIVRRYSFNRYG